MLIERDTAGACAGSSLPRRLTARSLTIIFSILRSLALTILLCFSLLLPGPASAFNPLSPLDRFDVFFVDQQSVCVPLLRFITGRESSFTVISRTSFSVEGGKSASTLRAKAVSETRRAAAETPVPPADRQARRVGRLARQTSFLSNSHFTSKVYARAFPSLAKRPPRVVYPCIDVDAYAPRNSKGKGRAKHEDDVMLSGRALRSSLTLHR